MSFPTRYITVPDAQLTRKRKVRGSLASEKSVVSKGSCSDSNQLEPLAIMYPPADSMQETPPIKGKGKRAKKPQPVSPDSPAMSTRSKRRLDV
ncbi:hypothetical protein ACP4OV_023185 [Aristida adscensionis]